MKFCTPSELRLWRTGMLLLTNSKGHKSNSPYSGFPNHLQINDIKARIAIFWCFEKEIFLKKILKFQWNFALSQNWGCGGQGGYFWPNQRIITQMPPTQDSQNTFKPSLTCIFVSARTRYIMSIPNGRPCILSFDQEILLFYDPPLKKFHNLIDSNIKCIISLFYLEFVAQKNCTKNSLAVILDLCKVWKVWRHLMIFDFLKVVLIFFSAAYVTITSPVLYTVGL